MSEVEETRKRPKTGGRKAGTPNKATAEIKDIARQYGPDCIAKLWALASSAESEQAKVSAIKEILDRGYGKASQAITGENGGPVALTVGWLSPGA